ncbi:MAG: glucose 1-dehydrogenase [Deltaproteobacteria bacterium]|jgi:NAD(P)-dependent dehydrogenase (short-subunit alcohol dehydrogenase family)
MDSPLKDKVAIVTGASRGIGEAIARTMAAQGARVVLASRKQPGLDAVKAQIEADGGEAIAVACHTGDPEQIRALVAKTVETYGQVDALVNNAATNPYFGPMLGVETAAWDKTFDVNVRGYFEASRAVAEHLMEAKRPGAIVNVSSILGLRGGRFQGVYAMTKAAVISMTKTLAIELGPEQIRVNAVAPGFIETKFSQALVDNPQIKEMILTRTPLGRIGAPEDIAPLVSFLASDASSFITGATFTADGGLTVE